MEIVKWLSPQSSAVSGIALVKVKANEIADIEEMLKLVDGDSVGNFGINVSLIKTGEGMPVTALSKCNGKVIGVGYYEAERQFGFPCASSIKRQIRYYKVSINRD